MNAILCLAALGALVALVEAQKCAVEVTGDMDHDYEVFMKCYFPDYKPDRKDRERLEKFKKCYDKFTNQSGNANSHEIGFTPFCYLTDDEIKAGKNNRLKPDVMPPGKLPDFKFDAREPLPASVNWVTKKVVTPVKNQGQCGSCYTFAAVAALEAACAIKTGKLVEFSEQQYVDCSYQYAVRTWTQKSCDKYGKCTTKTYDTWEVVPGSGNQGCNGGDYRSAWAYNNKSRQHENAAACYPYKADKTLKNEACKYNSACPTKAVVSGYVNVPDNVAAVMQALANHGPLACAVNADKMKYYKAGVITTPETGCNHAVLLVGYDTDKVTGKQYWLLKNSWGPNWGEDGYFKLEIKQYADAVGANGLSSCAYPLCDKVGAAAA